jgi:hypothetical protein
VKNSWEDVGPQVGYQKNLHEGYETREEKKQAYSELLE